MDRTNSSLLIVDDKKKNRDLLCKVLQREGYIVATANTGEEALQMLELESYDLILLDIMMPGMNGIEVLTNIRANPETKHIPVMMVTALNDKESVVQCIQLGASEYVSKPFDITILKSRVWRCLETGSYCDITPEQLENESQGNILIVDDNDLNRDLLARRMQQTGYHYNTAQHGYEALDMIDNFDIDLVLLDIHMPHLDGITTLEKIKQSPETRRIPVIMLTADTSDATMQQCLKLGADDYITKPFNALLLKARMAPLVKIKHKQDNDESRQQKLKQLASLGMAIKTPENL